jgi:hypothetical protein
MQRAPSDARRKGKVYGGVASFNVTLIKHTAAAREGGAAPCHAAVADVVQMSSTRCRASQAETLRRALQSRIVAAPG